MSAGQSTDFPQTVRWTVHRTVQRTRVLCTRFGLAYDGLIYQAVALQGVHVSPSGRLLHVVQNDGLGGKGLMFLLHAAPSFPSDSGLPALSTMRST